MDLKLHGGWAALSGRPGQGQTSTQQVPRPPSVRQLRAVAPPLWRWLVSMGVLAMGLEKPDGSGWVGQGQAHLILLVYSLGFEQEVRVAHHHHHVLELQARGW